jgi:hypothetical protein
MRQLPLALLSLGLAACGAGGNGQDAAPTDTGVCGTYANPGILKLTNLTPGLNTTVYNQAIEHGFTVVNAPAQFSSFDFKYGPSHTAGLPSPEKPRFQLTTIGSDVVYRLTIDSWARSPGHVEVQASGGYNTLAGCAWSFPSPLFSYDVVGEPDGGAGSEASGPVDGATSPIDGTLIPVFYLDAPLKFDGETVVDSPGPIDAATRPIDAAIDAPAGPLDAAIDL